MSQEPKVIDADKFNHPYLNKVTVNDINNSSSVGSRTGFEEEGILVKMDDPMCARFKGGKYEVFISADVVKLLYRELHPGSFPSCDEVEDESEEINLHEFPGLYLSDPTVEDRIEDVTMVEYPVGAPKFEDRGFAVTHKLNNCSQQVFISNTLLDHLNHLREEARS